MNPYKLIISAVSTLTFMGCTQLSSIFQMQDSYERSTVVLLNNKKIRNAVIVTTNKGSQKLDKIREFVDLKDKNTVPSEVEIMSKEELKHRFSDVLKALPKKRPSFLLYFKSNSLILDTPSKELINKIVQSIINEVPCRVDIIGHTDTVGSNKDNIATSLLQAKSVEGTLKEEILKLLEHRKDITLIRKGYGEEDLFVETLDNRKEEKNRNVEIFIK